MSSIKQIHQAAYHPIADLITYSPLPNRKIDQIDPFLFLNHHGHQVYPAHNSGLPFGPHPHRGMQTVTFILKGDIMHQDSQGYKSVIDEGGVQWMVAGSGLLHSEISSEKFKKEGGELEILQLWINLPAKLKMTAPTYAGLQKEDIPTLKVNEKTTLNLISGIYQEQKGAFESPTELFLATLELEKNAKWQTTIPKGNSIFCYLVKGKAIIDGKEILEKQLVEFEINLNHETSINFEAMEESILIWGYALPFNEPLVAKGPFVMNSEKEIMEAFQDYQLGKFGVWKE